ncbi:MAG: hypothetical protein ACREC6_08480 [Hyphomicrobiaceae bacterium]
MSKNGSRLLSSLDDDALNIKIAMAELEGSGCAQERKQALFQLHALDRLLAQVAERVAPPAPRSRKHRTAEIIPFRANQ